MADPACFFAEFSGWSGLACFLEYFRQIIQDGRAFAFLGTVQFLHAGQLTAKEGFGFGEFTAFELQAAEDAHGPEGVGVVGSERGDF
jgi:hypothetical protein